VRAGLLAFVFAAVLSAASISGVTNAAGTLPPGLPNSGVAQGAIFVVYGAGLGPAKLQQAQSFPLPATQGLGGTTVQVTVGGVTETCIMIYSSDGQVAAILPSATPVGLGTLTVNYQGDSASIALQVVTATFGTYTLNEGGTGPAVVTDANYNAITMVNPAHPGQTLILWGTGLGASTDDETLPPQQVDLGTGVQVYIENQPATVLYAGRSTDPGLDQINFTVPTGISGGCKTSLAVLEQGVVGNVTTMAIAPAGQSTCGDTLGFLTQANLKKAVSTGTLNIADVALYRFGSNSDTLAADFANYPVASLVSSYGGSVRPSPGSCTAYETYNTSTVIDPLAPLRLDAGPNLLVTGTLGDKTVIATSTGYYPSVLGAAGSFIEAGAYAVSNGSGGADVGVFDWKLIVPAPVGFTNLPAVINRSQDLTVTWSGGSAFPLVSIFGVSGVPQGGGNTSYVQFYCTATGSAGQFTIPTLILNLLPTNGYGAAGVTGAAIEIAGVEEHAFAVSGIDVAIFNSLTYSGRVLTVQ